MILFNYRSLASGELAELRGDMLTWEGCDAAQRTLTGHVVTVYTQTHNMPPVARQQLCDTAGGRSSAVSECVCLCACVSVWQWVRAPFRYKSGLKQVCVCFSSASYAIGCGAAAVGGAVDVAPPLPSLPLCAINK